MPRVAEVAARVDSWGNGEFVDVARRFQRLKYIDRGLVST